MRSRDVAMALSIALAAVAGQARAQGRPAKTDPADEQRASAALAAAPRPTTLRPGPHFAHLTTTDGLPQSNVTAIAQDRVGFMWFGTQEGLARYDGTRFQVFQHRVDGTSPLPSSYVTALAVDERGGLWIGTERGLALYDVERDVFQVLRKSSEEPGQSTEAHVTALHVVGRTLWVAYQHGDLERFDTETRASRRFELEIGAPIRSLASNKEGTLWVGTLGKGLLTLDAAGKVVSHHRYNASERDGLPSNTINALLVARDGTLWIGSEDPNQTEGGGGLARSLGDGRYKTVGETQRLTDPRVTFLMEDDAGRLWIGSKNGLTRMDPRSGLTQRFEADRADPGKLSFSWLTSGYVDPTGVVWIGTFASGVDRFDPTTSEFEFASIQATPTAFLEQGEDLLWMGTIPGSLIRFDRRTERAQTWSQLSTAGGETIDLAPHWITDIKADAGGKLWLAVLGLGLLSFDPQTGVAEQHRSGDEQAEGAWRLVPTADGRVWIASWGGGLLKFDPARRTFARYTSETGMPTDFLYTVVADRQDPKILWIGTAKEGLVRFDTSAEKADIFRSVRERPDTLSNNDVLSIDQSKDGQLWIGTYGGGLNRFDPAKGKFERISQSIGLTNDTIYGVLIDDRQTLWLATNGGGLVRLDPGTRHAVSFNAREGLPDEYAQGSFYVGPSGRFYFGSPTGIAVWFRPEQVRLDPVGPKVVVTSLQLHNQERQLDRPIWSGPPIELGPSDTLLSFRLAGLAFASPSRIRYQYSLDQGEWIGLAGPTLTLNLPTFGDYELRVRAANRHGVWGPTSAPIAIHVATPLWRRWWAYVAYAAVALLLLLSIYRLHSRRLARIERSLRYSAMERDLELTAAVQTGFLPKDDRIVAEDLVLKGFYRPASTCSGDWWWYELSDENEHLILVGDVTGHGAGPAMVTAAVASAFRVQRDVNENGGLSRRLHAVNQEVLRVANGEYQMALTAIRIDGLSGTMTAYSAGGVPAILVADGATPSVMLCRGTPLGTESFVLGETTRAVTPGTRIFISTDGVIECEMNQGRRFGMRRLIKVLERTSALDVDEAVAALSEEVTAAAVGPQEDDWTFMVADWRAGARQAIHGPSVQRAPRRSTGPQ
jgi:ligand-binding sensor domain-containing protein/serine phosphatase RsbU (regulator of sigma subunit)